MSAHPSLLVVMRRVREPDHPIIPALLPELSAEVIQWLDVEDLVRARGANSAWDQCVAAILAQRVRRLFGENVADYDALGACVQKTRAVIGGLGAVHVLFPEHSAPPFVEFFTPNWAHDAFLSHLVYEEGFKRAMSIPLPPASDDRQADGAAGQRDNTTPAGGSSPKCARDAAAELVDDRRGRRGVAEVAFLTKGSLGVYVVQSTVDSALYPITMESNSALFTYIGPQHFSCAYPALTRASRALFNPAVLTVLDGVPPRIQRVADHWEGQGWVVSKDWVQWSPSAVCSGAESAGCAAACRYFGDRFCVSGALSPVRWREEREWWYGDEIETVMWWRGGRTCSRTCHRGVMRLNPGSRVCHRATLMGL